MKQATFRFYEELNDFLSRDRRKTQFEYQFAGRPSVKDVIEMIGVPHSEIDLIIANGLSVDFDYRIQAGDFISVYPLFEALDISPIYHLRPKPLRKIKFILDAHLGRLAKYLRICGFDCYFEDIDDLKIIDISLEQQRIILTKDRGLLKNRKVTHGYWVRSSDTHQQLLEIFQRFDLINHIRFLVRCLICNSKLVKISKEEADSKVPPHTSDYYSDFYACLQCQKIYWEGSHYNNMEKLINYIKTHIKL